MPQVAVAWSADIILLYNGAQPIEPRDFVMFCFMTCDCSLVWLGPGFESATLGHFSEKSRGSMGWESGYIEFIYTGYFVLPLLPN